MRVWLVLCLALACSGCAQWRNIQIDPSGDHLFVSKPNYFQPVPGCKPKHWNDCTVNITPTTVIAPVGTEVVLLAGVCGFDGYFSAGERVEWMMEPGGQGHFVDYGGSSFLGRLLNTKNHPRKIDNTFLISKTQRKYISLTRGTPNPADDVNVLRGQAWTSVTSAVEGTSHVTAFAPEVYNWEHRLRTAVIHWIDASWIFPPPAVNPVGTRHTFTTFVTRASDQSPLPGFRVRYEILSGPAAGFAPDGSRVIEVTTDDLGQGRAEIIQQEAVAGTNQIGIQIIRPADISGPGGSRLVLASGSTTKTWSSSAELTVRKTGPSEAGIGTTATYRIEVSNPGGGAMRDVVVTDQVPQGMTVLSSTPPGTPGPVGLQWRLGDLASGQQRVIEVNLRPDRAGTFNNCATVTSADGRTAQDCASTTVMTSGLEVQITGPAQGLVGQDVTFEINLTNRGSSPVSGLLLVNRFDAGLTHAVSASPIERDLEDLAPGQTRKVPVTFKVTQTGRLCVRVEARGEGGVRGSSEACIDGFDAQRAEPSRISIRKTGPARAAVDGTVEFLIEVTNNGQQVARDLKITDSYDDSLVPTELTGGYTAVGSTIVWSLPSLDPGRTILFKVNCRCRQPNPRACNRVNVIAGDGSRADSESCVEIAPSAPALSVTFTGLRDTVAAGRELTYEVLIKNNSPTSDTQVRVAVAVPGEMTPVRIGTSGPTGAQIIGQTVQFDPVAEVRPGETLRFQVRVLANRAGAVRAQATVTSGRQAVPIVVQTPTTITGG